MIQGSCYLCKVVDELPIVGRQPQEASQLSNIGRGWPVRNSTDLGRVCTYSLVGNHMAKETDTLLKKLTLPRMKFELCFL